MILLICLREATRKITSAQQKAYLRHLRCLLSICNRCNIIPASSHKQLQRNRNIGLFETTALDQCDLSQSHWSRKKTRSTVCSHQYLELIIVKSDCCLTSTEKVSILLARHISISDPAFRLALSEGELCGRNTHVGGECAATPVLAPFAVA